MTLIMALQAYIDCLRVLEITAIHRLAYIELLDHRLVVNRWHSLFCLSFARRRSQLIWGASRYS